MHWYFKYVVPCVAVVLFTLGYVMTEGAPGFRVLKAHHLEVTK